MKGAVSSGMLARLISLAIDQGVAVKKRLLKMLTLTLLCVITAAATGQEVPPVFWSAERPTTDYLGNEPARVHQWLTAKLKELGPTVDQFSTREERAAKQRATNAAMDQIGPLPFVARCSKKYDPDAQQYEVSVWVAPILDPLLKDPDPAAFQLRRLMVAWSRVSTESYQAQNAYGAQITVQRIVEDEYALVYPAGAKSEPQQSIRMAIPSAPRDSAYRMSQHQHLLRFSLPPSEARDADASIACLYVMSLDPPYVLRYTERNFPTRDTPFDRTLNGTAFFGRLDRIVVINKSSGTVYAATAR